MKDKFEYWVNAKSINFLIIFWPQFAFWYCLALWFSTKNDNPFIFLLIGLIPYFIVMIYRMAYNPTGSIEEGLKKHDGSLYENLLKNIPSKHCDNPKIRSTLILTSLLKLSEKGLNSQIASFKKNYWIINKVAMLSLTLWFLTFLALTFLLYVT